MALAITNGKIQYLESTKAYDITIHEETFENFLWSS
jgi:hypothetical protein